MGKVENNDVRDYIVNYAISTLESCKLFTDTFGKGYVKKRLDINLDKVYTNEYLKTREKGYYDTGNLSLTLCSEKDTDEVMMPADIQNSPVLRGRALHELVHAISNRTKQECKRYNINWGTGIVEEYNTEENNRVIEIGRGLNEGLTNWICKKAGVEVDAYSKLTNFVNILELGTSDKNVMKLAKGNVRKNMPRLTGMDFNRCMYILGLTDQIELIERRVIELAGICEVLTKHKTKDNFKPDERQKIEADYKALESNLLYMNVLYGSPEYEEGLAMQGKEDTEVERIFYIQEKQEGLNEQLAQDVSEVLATLFVEYFKDTLESEMAIGKISEETMQKLDKLREYSVGCEVSKKYHVSAIDNIRTVHQTVEEVYCRRIMEEAKENIENGGITGTKLEELTTKYNRGRKTIPKAFISQIASLINPGGADRVQALLSDLFSNGEMSEAAKYSILNVKFGNREINAYQKSGEIVTTEYNGFRKATNEYVPAGEFKSFTLSIDEEGAEIIKQFQELKSSILRQNPNAQIRIVNRLIIVKTEQGESYYGIDEGRVLQGNVQKERSIKLNIAVDEKQLPIPRKVGIVDRLIRAFRRKVYSNQKEGIVYSTENEERKTSRQAEFKSQISNMANYDNNTVTNEQARDLISIESKIEEEEL